jgi:RNA polymerase sigma-70 factor (ECF subfamily)
MKLSQQTTANGSLVARLYEEHSPALFAYLRYQTGSPESAEDALIEVFVAALEQDKFAELSEKEQVSWLWRVARNKGIDAYRRARVRQGLDLVQFAEHLEDNQPVPESIALQREAFAHLHAYIEKLSPIQQEVVRLRFAHGLNSSEIARAMGKRDGTVRSLLARALNFLRQLYAKEQEEVH